MQQAINDYAGLVSVVVTVWVVSAFRFFPSLIIEKDCRFAINVSLLAAILIAVPTFWGGPALNLVSAVLVVTQVVVWVALHTLFTGPGGIKMAIHDRAVAVLAIVAMAASIGHIAVATITRSLA